MKPGLLVVLLLAAGCGSKAGTAACEKARDAYLTSTTARVNAMIEGVPPDHRDFVREQSLKELRATRAGFVDACVATRADVTCFTDPAQTSSDRCKPVVDAVMERVLPH